MLIVFTVYTGVTRHFLKRPSRGIIKGVSSPLRHMLSISVLLFLDLLGHCHPFTLNIADFELKHGVGDEGLDIVYWSLDWGRSAERKLAVELMTSPKNVLGSSFQKCLPDNFITDGIIQEIMDGGLCLDDVLFSTYIYVHTPRIQQLYSKSNLAYKPDLVLLDDIHPDRLSRQAFTQVLDFASKHPETIGNRRVEKIIASLRFPHNWMYLSNFRTHTVVQKLAETKPLILLLTLMIQKISDINYDIIFKLLEGKNGQEVKAFRNILQTRMRQGTTRRYMKLVKSAVWKLERSFHSLWYGRMSLAVLGLCIRDFAFRDNFPPFCLEPAFEWLSQFAPPKIVPYQFQEFIRLLNQLRRNPFRYFESFGSLNRARMVQLERRFPWMTCPWLDIEEQIHIWEQSLPKVGYLDDSLGDFPLTQVPSSRLVVLMGQKMELTAALRFHPQLRRQISVEFQDGSVLECADARCLVEAACRSLLHEYHILQHLSHPSYKTKAGNIQYAVKAFALILLLNLVQTGAFRIKLERENIDAITSLESFVIEGRNISLVRDLVASTKIWNWLSSWEIRDIALRNSEGYSLTDKLLGTGVSLAIILLIILCSTLITVYWNDITH